MTAPTRTEQASSTCVEVRGLLRLWRRFCTRLLHGGPCGVPCERCGRQSTYWGRYCEAYMQELAAVYEGDPTYASVGVAYLRDQIADWETPA